jgi:AraC-like DNA-binding protein
MQAEYPLILRELTVPAASEWKPQRREWIVAGAMTGAGYALLAGNARELNAGDGFMIPASTKMLIRASQLGPLRVQFFEVQPQFLNGLLTVTECHQLKILSHNPTCAVFFKASDSTGKKFARLAVKVGNEHLSGRCAMLAFWANGIAHLLSPPVVVSPTDNKKLRQRFHRLVGRIPEAGLFEHSLTDFAKELHCSERHLGRLFREEFGASFRSLQIEERLHHARRLLRETDHKIANVASECGYRHIGLFNATFKRLFGMSPGEWRRQNSLTNSKPPADEISL